MKFTRTSLRGVPVAAATALAILAAPSAQAETEAPINIVINQSPWLEGFANVVDLYEEQTGNKVSLDVNPYAGSLEKQRNAVRAAESEYDILIVNGIFYPEMYQGGFLEPLTDIDPEFKLDPQIYTFDDTLWYDGKTKTVNRETGDLLTIPVNPNITMMFYRADLYEKYGLEIPETWDQLLANAKVIQEKEGIVGMMQRAARAAISISWDYWPYMNSYGGSLFRDESNGDFFVTLNSPESLEALKMYLKIANEVGPPNPAAMDQATLIQYLVTGQAAHAILPVAAQSQMDDPNKSAVVGKIGYMNLPHAPGHDSAPAIGHWLAGVPKNIPDENKKAALAFLSWFQKPETQIAYAEMGGSPVSAAAYESDFADKPENRYMITMRKALPTARRMWTIPEGAEIVAVTEVGLNRAVAGEISAVEALNSMAAEIEKIMRDAGYKTGRLPDLTE
ncbi:extracellular solute-binding protein [Frigidibacter sp. ROC022]|uniref:extracellular solute-binding protein n=1 Tax=Frigidibacter sp. ROC022 TaxID=2971796 RepID=UPI00215B1055|nr:extracellular solute-binding protein [Frigidibacter sp. ROC022]MCR8723734.1 extracellular solute-binding protein [Frigidibacter sp. ROC022]